MGGNWSFTAKAGVFRMGMGCAPCSALAAPEPLSEVKENHLLHQNFRLLFFNASCTASWVEQALSSVK